MHISNKGCPSLSKMIVSEGTRGEGNKAAALEARSDASLLAIVVRTAKATPAPRVLALFLVLTLCLKTCFLESCNLSAKQLQFPYDQRSRLPLSSMVRTFHVATERQDQAP